MTLKPSETPRMMGALSVGKFGITKGMHGDYDFVLERKRDAGGIEKGFHGLV